MEPRIQSGSSRAEGICEAASAGLSIHNRYRRRLASIHLQAARENLLKELPTLRSRFIYPDEVAEKCGPNRYETRPKADFNENLENLKISDQACDPLEFNHDPNFLAEAIKQMEMDLEHHNNQNSRSAQSVKAHSPLRKITNSASLLDHEETTTSTRDMMHEENSAYWF